MKEKKARAVTAADLIIVIVLLLFGLFVFEYVFAASPEDTYEIVYVVKVSEVRSELRDRVTVGDSVYCTDGSYMGVVSAVETRAAVLESGKTLPDRYDLYITIAADASGDGVVSGHELYAERELEMYAPGLYFECVCISVRK